MRGRRIVVVEPPKPKPKPVATRPAPKPRPAPPRARVPANQLQREQAQLEAEFESLSDAARTVEARTEDVSRLAAQFATLVDEQHDQVVTLDGLVGDTANQVDKAGDHVAQAASKRATLPRVFNAVGREPHAKVAASAGAARNVGCLCVLTSRPVAHLQGLYPTPYRYLSRAAPAALSARRGRRTCGRGEPGLLPVSPSEWRLLTTPFGHIETVPALRRLHIPLQSQSYYSENIFPVGAASPRHRREHFHANSRRGTESDPAPTNVPGSGAAPRRGRFAAGAAVPPSSGT